MLRVCICYLEWAMNSDRMWAFSLLLSLEIVQMEITNKHLVTVLIMKTNNKNEKVIMKILSIT